MFISSIEYIQTYHFTHTLISHE